MTRLRLDIHGNERPCTLKRDRYRVGPREALTALELRFRCECGRSATCERMALTAAWGEDYSPVIGWTCRGCAHAHGWRKHAHGLGIEARRLRKRTHCAVHGVALTQPTEAAPHRRARCSICDGEFAARQRVRWERYRHDRDPVRPTA